LAVGGLIAAAELRPQWCVLVTRGNRLRELRQMKKDLPLVERQVVESQKPLAQAREQRALLLNVIADSGGIRTFLSELSGEAARTRVTLAFYEPLAGEIPPPECQPGRSEAPPPELQDPLAPEGYERRAMLLRS